MAGGSSILSDPDYREHVEYLQRRIFELEDFVSRIERNAADTVAFADELASAKQKLEQAHRRAEESMRRANAVLDTVIDGIFSISPSMNPVSWNRLTGLRSGCSTAALPT
jgi:PAS domain-containing protein